MEARARAPYSDLVSEAEAELNRRCKALNAAWMLSEDLRPGPESLPVKLLADGRFDTPQDDTRWYSACAFTLPGKEVIAATEEVHGGLSARELVLRQLLSRLDSPDAA